MIDNNDSLIIWYIPGFCSGNDPQIDIRLKIQRLYPNAREIKNVIWENQRVSVLDFVAPVIDSSKEVTVLKSLISLWGSVTNSSTPSNVERPAEFTVRWIKALNDVATISNMLTNRIRSLSSDKRRKLFLIGHSLGGNVVIRTLAQLYRQNISIHSALLLGAAIGNKDKDIPSAINATLKPIHSMYNPNDEALAVFDTISTMPALGKNGCELEYDCTKFHEHCTAYSTTHSSDFYLSQWAVQQRLASKSSVLNHKNINSRFFERYK